MRQSNSFDGVGPDQHDLDQVVVVMLALALGVCRQRRLRITAKVTLSDQGGLSVIEYEQEVLDLDTASTPLTGMVAPQL